MGGDNGGKPHYQTEHQLGAYTNCNHGEGLAVLHPVYYRHIYKYGLPKFKRFATEVMGVSTEGKTDEEIALAGIEALEDFIVEIGLPVSLQDLGVNKNDEKDYLTFYGACYGAVAGSLLDK